MNFSEKESDFLEESLRAGSSGDFFPTSLGVDDSLLVNRMLWEMVKVIRREAEEQPMVGSHEWMTRGRFLSNHFLQIRVDFARRVVARFQGRLVACGLSCFLNQNQLPHAIQQCRSHLCALEPK